MRPGGAYEMEDVLCPYMYVDASLRNEMYTIYGNIGQKY